jgi:hypothetical protein
VAVEPIKVTGLREFNRDLKKIDKDLPKVLRLANNDVAQLIVDWAKPKFPKKTGAAARTVKVASTRTEVRVREGSAKVPYVPWLDFGGRVGRARSIKRAFYSDGRYLWPGLIANREQATERLAERLMEVCRAAGVDVTDE